MESRLKIVILCIDYFQCNSSVFAMQALDDVCLKSACALYTSVYYKRDITVLTSPYVGSLCKAS